MYLFNYYFNYILFSCSSYDQPVADAVFKRFDRENHTFSPPVPLLDLWLFESAGKLYVNLIPVQQSTSS